MHELRKRRLQPQRFFEIARKRLYIHAMLERKEEEYNLLNVFAEALPFLVIDCKERIAKNECTAK